jgi:predicted PurR-regulated permease PerM
VEVTVPKDELARLTKLLHASFPAIAALTPDKRRGAVVAVRVDAPGGPIECIAHYLNQLSQWWVSFTHTPAPIPSLGEIPGVSGSVLTTIFGVFSTVLSILLVMVLTFYFTAEEQSMRRALLTLLPNRYGPDITRMLNNTQRRLGLWLRGQLILSLIIGLLVYIGLSIIGIKYALILALLATLLEVVPFVGPVIAGAVASLLALSMGYSWTVVGLVILLYFVVQQLENNLIVPKILGESVQINPLLIIIAVLVGAKLGGVVGALLGVPVVAIIAEVAKDAWSRRPAED